MRTLLFATGNTEKLEIANTICNPNGITLVMFNKETHEIQSEDPTLVLLHKLNEKFELAEHQPLAVSDDSWDIPGLKGFPGPYMKSIDEWFEPQNMIDLMQHVSDKTIILHQYLGYKDKNQVKIFHSPIHGTVLSEPKGKYGKPMQKVVALNRDNGLSISEVYDANLQHNPDRFAGENNVWAQFVSWINN